MAKTNKYSVKNLKKDFPNDAVCLKYLFDVLHTKECSCSGEYAPLFEMVYYPDKPAELKGRKQLQCSKCRYQIAPMAGTIFEKSTTPLTMWFHSIFIFSNAKSGISAKEMERQLGVTYKTAWRILHLIRASLYQIKDKLRGDVEMDETHIAGKGKVWESKNVAIGAIERGGAARVKLGNNAKAKTLKSFLDDNVEKEGTRLLTDKSNRYNKSARGYSRESVNHSKQEYVRGDVHVNTVDSFWGHIKRSIRGTHKTVSKKYLQTYLDAFVWHRNNRHNDRQRFETLLGVLVG
jgi:transposase-like protein